MESPNPMTATYYPFSLYFVRIPGKPGWTPGIVTAEPEAADGRIAALHPDATERRVFAQGASRERYDGGDAADKFAGLDHALDRGWWYDTRLQCWLAPEETAAVPVEKPLPATPRLETDEPCNGWWSWRLAFFPLVSNDAAIWEHLFGGGEVRYDFDISDVFDPLAELTAFAAALRAGRDARLVVNEEGCFTALLTWRAEGGQAHLRLMSLCRQEDVKFDFLVDGAALAQMLENALRRFHEQGGWAEPD